MNDLLRIDCSIFRSYVEGFFPCQITAIRFPIINQQNTKYPGIAICFTTENAPSHRIMSHLTRRIHMIIVKQ